MIDPYYPTCPFSIDVVELKEVLSNNYTKPLGKHCCSCSETNCNHNSTRL